MTASQALVGAMGLASWRIHHRLNDYTDVAPTARTVAHQRRPHGAVGKPVDKTWPSEVGLTDGVMSALWRFGPRGVSHSVSGKAEKQHLGSDIALVLPNRILLYQAKVARLSLSGDPRFILKSKVSDSQLKLLAQDEVVVGGTSYRVTGRLALYQIDRTPHLGACHATVLPESGWALPSATPAPVVPHSDVGRQYYESVLRLRGCSPSGVLAARPTNMPAKTSVLIADTWPWEFDSWKWLSGHSPLDGPTPDGATDLEAPDFPPLQIPEDQASSEDLEFADTLAAALGTSRSRRLYVIRL